jgi:hypothetical protein
MQSSHKPPASQQVTSLREPLALNSQIITAPRRHHEIPSTALEDIDPSSVSYIEVCHWFRLAIAQGVLKLCAMGMILRMTGTGVNPANPQAGGGFASGWGTGVVSRAFIARSPY